MINRFVVNVARKCTYVYFTSAVFFPLSLALFPTEGYEEMNSVKLFVAILFLVIVQPVLAQASQVGSAASDFNLTDLNGNTVSLQQFKGKVLFLDFWAPWCDECREEIPALDALYRKYNNDGLVVIGADIDTSEKLLMDFLQKAPLSFTIVMDKKGAMRRSYRFRTLPTAFIIGKDGIIRYVHLGYGKEFLQMYEKEIIELLKQP